MDGQFVTTPFGRRPMTLGMLASQAAAQEIEPGKTVDKWKLFRSLCEAKPVLGVSDRALSVLNALLSFYPRPDLSDEQGLVVFPSNAQLSLRAHGMSGTTLRRHLAGLVEAGLLVRKDSPNGKRYARQDGAGEIDEAFGFSLAPLLARADEIAAIAASIIAERLALQRLRERTTICRRDIAKLIEAAIDEGVPGDWAEQATAFQAILATAPRRREQTAARDFLDRLEKFRDCLVKRLEINTEIKKSDGNDDRNDRHIHNSKTRLPTESEPAPEKEPGDNPDWPENPDDVKTILDHHPPAVDRQREFLPRLETRRAFPLPVILQACPEIRVYGPAGAIDSWRDLMAAAVVVRSMLGVSPSAYEEACVVLGPENAAIVAACILEKAGHIHSPGGYLRGLVRRAERDEFSIGPMVMALLRANGVPRRGAGA